jgi:hypothetical protein
MRLGKWANTLLPPNPPQSLNPLFSAQPLHFLFQPAQLRA